LTCSDAARCVVAAPAWPCFHARFHTRLAGLADTCQFKIDNCQLRSFSREPRAPRRRRAARRCSLAIKSLDTRRSRVGRLPVGRGAQAYTPHATWRETSSKWREKATRQPHATWRETTCSLGGGRVDDAAWPPTPGDEACDGEWHSSHARGRCTRFPPAAAAPFRAWTWQGKPSGKTGKFNRREKVLTQRQRLRAGSARRSSPRSAGLDPGAVSPCRR
jgi:hypothetical protein